MNVDINLGYCAETHYQNSLKTIGGGDILQKAHKMADLRRGQHIGGLVGYAKSVIREYHGCPEKAKESFKQLLGV